MSAGKLEDLCTLRYLISVLLAYLSCLIGLGADYCHVCGLHHLLFRGGRQSD